jgi:Phage phiEco32-like COOH.NH2 ligase-type 2
MLLSDERRRLMESVIEKGVDPSEVRAHMDSIGVAVPDNVIMRWESTLKRAGKTPALSGNPTLINRFMIGADPEYVYTSITGDYVFAQELELDTLTAFGCDMSGRQAELRAHPSKFALEVLASVLDTLRWAWAMRSNTRTYNWNASCYVNIAGRSDGCGGHIHFGRKRPQRKNEILALDGITKVLVSAGVLDRDGHMNRQQRTDYGKYGDFRLQDHGYEYRTMPTWLSNPLVAYTSLVASKLAVLLHSPLKAIRPRLQLESLVRSFQTKDDDAAILAKALEVIGFPTHDGSNFAPRWGLGSPTNVDYHKHYVPTSIPPDPTTVQELYEYFVRGTPIPVRNPRPTWDLYTLPKDVYKATGQPHYSGIPEIAQGLLSNGVKLHVGTPVHTMVIQSQVTLDPRKVQSWFREIFGPHGQVDYQQLRATPARTPQIIVMPMASIMKDRKANLHICRKVKQFLANPEVFPVCLAKDFSKTKFLPSYAPKEGVKRQYAGRILYAERGAL